MYSRSYSRYCVDELSALPPWNRSGLHGGELKIILTHSGRGFSACSSATGFG
jgi:hypothetical protein